MKEIQLTQGQVALVDDEDFERVSQFKWHAIFYSKYANGGRFIAARTRCTLERRWTVLLHRFIMNAQQGQIIDHIDGNPLNNQQSNLRFASHAENGRNNAYLLQKHNTSGFRGVSWNKHKNGWTAQIKYDGRQSYLGLFTDKLEAAKAYNEAAKKYHGEFATLNPIEGE